MGGGVSAGMHGNIAVGCTLMGMYKGRAANAQVEIGLLPLTVGPINGDGSRTCCSMQRKALGWRESLRQRQRSCRQMDCRSDHDLPFGGCDLRVAYHAVALRHRRICDTHAVRHRKTGEQGKQGKKQFHVSMIILKSPVHRRWWRVRPLFCTTGLAR
jgi:hypothetical protein